MAVTEKVISVSDFEKSIDPEELISILSGFGLVEPIADTIKEDLTDNFNTIKTVKNFVTDLTKKNNYKIKLKKEEEVPMVGTSFLLYTFTHRD